MYVTGTMLTVVVQGEKEVFRGRQGQRYGPRQYMVLPVDLPLQAREKAPNDKLPLLGLCLTLDRHLIAELLTDGGAPRPEPAINAPLVVSELETDLLDPLVRSLRFLDLPAAIAILATGHKSEIPAGTLCGYQCG